LDHNLIYLFKLFFWISTIWAIGSFPSFVCSWGVLLARDNTKKVGLLVVVNIGPDGGILVVFPVGFPPSFLPSLLLAYYKVV
jgi:hypothetical protein